MRPWNTVKWLLHSLSPEQAHKLALTGLRFVPPLLNPAELGNRTNLLGLSFPNPIGLAAGFDKTGDHYLALSKLGFGFIEIGTVTPKAQDGNPQPRLFRLPAANALINRMGFDNPGADYVARKLAKRSSYSGILGINIGKNRQTPADEAVKDYTLCIEKLYSLGDYYTINISAPSTPSLHKLQQPKQLAKLLEALVNFNEKMASSHGTKMPLLVKVAPELSEPQIEQMASLIANSGCDGVIATNTTTSRPKEIVAENYAGQPGGLSGAPLTKASTAAIKLWRSALDPTIALIGCGGILDGNAVSEKRAAGAQLVQLYSGLIYAGPKLVAEAAAAWSN